MRTRPLVHLIATLAAMVMVAVACSSDPQPARELFTGSAESSGVSTTLIPPIPTDPPAAPSAMLGDLEVPCGRSVGGVGSIADDLGIESTSIVIGTGNDRGGLHTIGSGRGIPEAIEAMAIHCNSLGGLAGRDVVVVDYDAAVTELAARTAEQCLTVAALVGQGYLRESDVLNLREECGLGAFGAWQPGLMAGEPFAIHGHLFALFVDPFTITAAVLGPDTAGGQEVRDQRSRALDEAGFDFEIVADIAYPLESAPNWDALAGDARRAGAGLVHVDGSCESAVVPFMRAAARIGWSPLVLAGPSAYDRDCVAAAALESLGLDRLFVELPFLPLEDGDDAPVTAAYAALLEEVAAPVTGDALLASSAFWRWAETVRECGSRLARSCLVEGAGSIVGWTAGGLHRGYDQSGATEPCVVVMGVADGAFERVLPAEPGSYDCDPDRSISLTETGG